LELVQLSGGIPKGEYERAILLSGTGIGMAIAANKIFGIYAAVCHDRHTIQESILRNNCNVLCIGSEYVDNITTEKLIESWLTLKFDPQSEYGQNILKIKKIEENQRAI
jgi:ribose 5-phosphate isomerase B